MRWGRGGDSRTITNAPPTDPNERPVATIYYVPYLDGFKFVLQECGPGTGRLINGRVAGASPRAAGGPGRQAQGGAVLIFLLLVALVAYLLLFS